AIGLFTIALGRYVSLGSLVGMFSAPFLPIMGNFSLASLALVVTLVLLAIVRHRQNIVKLARGTERRLGEKAGKAQDHA
ncbi:MAG TPA: glycerol-3-phosphate acyltransferase, partial [Trueperaceae bacterium]